MAWSPQPSFFVFLPPAYYCAGTLRHCCGIAPMAVAKHAGSAPHQNAINCCSSPSRRLPQRAGLCCSRDCPIPPSQLPAGESIQLSLERLSLAATQEWNSATVYELIKGDLCNGVGNPRGNLLPIAAEALTQQIRILHRPREGEMHSRPWHYLQRPPWSFLP